MSAVEATALGILEAVLTMTANALQGTVTEESVQTLVAVRGPLFEQAKSLRQGGRWSEAERTVVDRLVLADRALMRRLWRPRADAFRWLRERAPEVVKDMPHLAALDSDAA